MAYIAYITSNLEKRLKDFINEVKLYDDFSNEYFDKKFIGTINKIEPLENESTNKQKHLIRHYSIE